MNSRLLLFYKEIFRMLNIREEEVQGGNNKVQDIGLSEGFFYCVREVKIVCESIEYYFNFLLKLGDYFFRLNIVYIIGQWGFLVMVVIKVQR